MDHWCEQMADEIALLEEHMERPEAVAWARALVRHHGHHDAVVVAMTTPGLPSDVRLAAFDELAR
jgi:hypothetical protein